jgi:hypothetical protein
MDQNETEDLNNAINKIRGSNNEFDYSIELNENRIRGYKGYASIAFDLQIVADFISILLHLRKNDRGEEYDRYIERSLFVSSIITYARCFTNTDGRGVKLESKDCFGNSHPNFRRLHFELMEIRNQYLAHAGVSNSERIYANANFNIEKDNQVLIKLSFEIIGQSGLNDDELLEFLKMAKYLRERAIEKRGKAAKKYLASLSVEDKNMLLKEAVYKKRNIQD